MALREWGSVASKYEGSTLQIENWDKYNGRKDIENPAWFRLQNDIAFRDGFYDFSAEEFWVWVFVLSVASKRKKGDIVINSGYLTNGTRVSVRVLDSAIEKLQREQCVRLTLKSNHADVTLTCPTDNTNRQYKQTNKHDDSAHSVRFDFESLYEKYPRKEGKYKGLLICKRDITSPELFAALSGAIEKYIENISKNQTEGKFVKHFSTFMNSWRDWLDPDAGSSLDARGSRGIEQILSEEAS